MHPAQACRIEKDAHPERFCPSCLWRVDTRKGWVACGKHGFAPQTPVFVRGIEWGTYGKLDPIDRRKCKLLNGVLVCELPEVPPDDDECEECDGRGKVVYDDVYEGPAPCRACNGRGF
jgi:hypothetical protein